jgi:hypothetical protein
VRLSGPSTVTEERATPPKPPADESGWQRRRRLQTVFGDVLPETTEDERDPGATSDDEAQDHWLRSQVPPHHR